MAIRLCCLQHVARKLRVEQAMMCGFLGGLMSLQQEIYMLNLSVAEQCAETVFKTCHSLIA